MQCEFTKRGIAFQYRSLRLGESGTISLFGLQTIFVRSVKENLLEDSVQKNDFSKTCFKVTFICKFRSAPKKSKN